VAALRPRARLDVLEQFVYLAEQESVQLAERYLAAVECTCAHPVTGVRYRVEIDRLREIP